MWHWWSRFGLASGGSARELMRRLKPPLQAKARSTICWLCVASSVWAQSPSVTPVGIEPVPPQARFVTRPYRAPDVPPVRLGDSPRLRDLIRAGMLYLTVQDAIALALENNLDIEVARYDPILSQWQLERSEAGGALPGVPGGASQAGSVASGQGVAGSQAAAGVSIPGLNGGGGGATNASISQVGPITQVLDPLVQQTSTFSHVTTPEPNVVLSGTPALVSNSRVQTTTIQQGLLTGGTVSFSYSDHYLNENSPTDVLNPSSAPSLSLTFQHNVLRGLGRGVNARTINISKINLATSALNFKTQVIGTVVDVLNLYYGLVADLEDVKAKQSAFDVARQFFEDNTARERLGVVSGLDVTSSGGAGCDRPGRPGGFRNRRAAARGVAEGRAQPQGPCRSRFGQRADCPAGSDHGARHRRSSGAEGPGPASASQPQRSGGGTGERDDGRDFRSGHQERHPARGAGDRRDQSSRLGGNPNCSRGCAPGRRTHTSSAA